MKLKNKINKKFLVVALSSIALTAVSLGVAFWFILSEEVKNETKEYLSTVGYGYETAGNSDQLEKLAPNDYRVTLIAPDGKVLYDSNPVVDAGQMENHLGRPEIADAVKTGKGESARTSETLGKTTYYYAAKMSDGNILRVSRQADSIINILLNLLPVVVFIFVYVLLICRVMSAEFTKKLVKPIENMVKNIDDVEYDELRPMAQTIQQQNEEIKSQMANILEIEKVKQEFTANVSHELKTPLTSISGYAEMIETGLAKPEDTKEFAKKIHREAGRLLLLIEDIIELSHLEDSGLIKNIAAVDLLEVARECAEDLELYAQNHTVIIEVKGDKTIVAADKKMMYELIYNLTNNAIRYNKENGRVVITVSDSIDGAKIIVADTGIGIPEDHQGRIFERFYRVDKSRSKQTGGTGLGLAIVKHIVEQHKGSILLDSQENVGTVITVVFSNI